MADVLFLTTVVSFLYINPSRDWQLTIQRKSLGKGVRRGGGGGEGMRVSGTGVCVCVCGGGGEP